MLARCLVGSHVIIFNYNEDKRSLLIQEPSRTRRGRLQDLVNTFALQQLHMDSFAGPLLSDMDKDKQHEILSRIGTEYVLAETFSDAYCIRELNPHCFFLEEDRPVYYFDAKNLARYEKVKELKNNATEPNV